MSLKDFEHSDVHDLFKVIAFDSSLEICILFLFLLYYFFFFYFDYLFFTFLQGMSKFIAASKQATGLDKTRILLETRIQELNKESKKWLR